MGMSLAPWAPGSFLENLRAFQAGRGQVGTKNTPLQDACRGPAPRCASNFPHTTSFCPPGTPRARGRQGSCPGPRVCRVWCHQPFR